MTSETPPGQAERPRLSHDQLEESGLWGDLDPSHHGWLEAEEARSLGAAKDHARRRQTRSLVRRVALGMVALWLFLLALAMMKDGARGLAPVLGAVVEGPLHALGLGWLGALLVLSGSPVAASSLALLDGGSLSTVESYAMLVGSRLGAAFVVLAVGTLYAVRRSEGRRTPISVGVLALGMTFAAYLPGGLIGGLLLGAGWLDGIVLLPPAVFFDAIEALTEPVLRIVERVLSPEEALSGGLLFAAGVGVLLASFRLIDELLPSLESVRGDERARWYVGPWTMFGVGLLVALATLSVSVALSLLVPLVARGYVRREQTLPYIAGANITTLADTLVVAVLLQNDVAPRLVLALLIGVGLWTVGMLALGHRQVRQLAFSLQAFVLRSPGRLVAFVALLFVLPVALLLLG